MANSNSSGEIAEVEGGVVILNGATIIARWDGYGQETWTLPDNAWGREQARENFVDMVERWNGR